MYPEVAEIIIPPNSNTRNPTHGTMRTSTANTTQITVPTTKARRRILTSITAGPFRAGEIVQQQD
jgi:hypothetical protein